MRAVCKPVALLAAALVLLAGCSAGDDGQCLEGFCLPADAVVVGEERSADFTLYQIAWRGEQFGLYAGDSPNFSRAAARAFPVPVDANALLVESGGSAELLMRLGNASPQMLHLGGRCDTIETCTFGKLAEAITRKD